MTLTLKTEPDAEPLSLLEQAAIAAETDTVGGLQTSALVARCEACGEPIENPKRGQRFCYWPGKCRVSQWAEEHRRPYIVARAPRPCEFCGEPIENPRRDQRFCRAPRDCRARAGYERFCGRDGATTRYVARRREAGTAEGANAVASLPAVVSAAKPSRVSEVSPMIGILLESLPAPGASWPAEARAQWTAVFERTLDALYPAPRE